MVVPEEHEIALDIEAALLQPLRQGAGILHGEFHIVEQRAVHDDERVFDDVRDFVVAHIVERVRVAGAAAEAAPFREPEGVVVGDAGISPQIQRVGIIREKGTEVVLAGDTNLLVAKLAEILFLFLETLRIIC